MLPRLITSILPVLKKQQTCEACGTSFACEIDLERGCWCAGIKVGDGVRAELRRQYRNCLCRSCLEQAAAADLPEKRKDNGSAGAVN